MVGRQTDGKELADAGEGDILQVDVVDHYNNLTLKSVSMLKYFAKTAWKVRRHQLAMAEADFHTYVLLMHRVQHLKLCSRQTTMFMSMLPF